MNLVTRAVTIEDISDVGRVSKAIDDIGFHEKPWVRVVFQKGEGPEEYLEGMKELRKRAKLMGLFYDSTAMKGMPMRSVRRKMESFLRGKQRIVELLDGAEVWNEINEEGTTGPSPQACEIANYVHDQIAAIPQLKTFGCWYLTAQEPGALWSWMAKHPLPVVDYALLSHYAGWNGWPDNWVTTFRHFRDLAHPRVGVGIAEWGLQPPENPEKQSVWEWCHLLERYDSTIPKLMAEQAPEVPFVGFGGAWDFGYFCRYAAVISKYKELQK